MPATIILQSPSGVDDKRIRLANAQFARPFDFGSWTKIRIFMRWACADSATMMSGSTTWMFGLCSGTTNLPGDATTTHAIGVGSNSTWNGGSNASYYGFGTRFNFLSRIGSTVALLNVDVAATNAAIGHPTPAQRSLLFVDFTKGSPNWTGQVQVARNSSTLTVDTSYDDMMTYAELESTGAVSGHIVAQTARTFAVDEATNGTLDSICLWWPRTSPVIEISDIGVVRFS